MVVVIQVNKLKMKKETINEHKINLNNYHLP